MQNLAFTQVKMHFPSLLPLFKFLKVWESSLLGIIRVWESSLLVMVKCTAGTPYSKKKSDLWIYVFRQVIYVQEEQDWSKDRTLGRPRSDVDHRRFSLSKATYCERPSKKALIQLRLFRIIPCWWSLKSSFVWLTLSKALLKSRSMRSVWRPEERPLTWSSMSLINWVLQDLRSLNHVVSRIVCYGCWDAL